MRLRGPCGTGKCIRSEDKTTARFRDSTHRTLAPRSMSVATNYQGMEVSTMSAYTMSVISLVLSTIAILLVVFKR